MKFLHTARRAGAAAAMARIGMAQEGRNNGHSKGAIDYSIIIVPAAFHPPPRLAAPTSYSATDIKGYIGQGKRIIITSPSAPIHIALSLIALIFMTLVV